MTLDRFINVSFALALLFIVLAITFGLAGLAFFHTPILLLLFGGLGVLFGVLELGGIAVFFLTH